MEDIRYFIEVTENNKKILEEWLQKNFNKNLPDHVIYIESDGWRYGKYDLKKEDIDLLTDQEFYNLVGINITDINYKYLIKILDKYGL